MDLTDKLFEYLKTKIPTFSKTTKKGAFLFSCPNLNKHKYIAKSPTATFVSGTNKINCLQCNWKGTIYDVVRLLESEKKNYEDAQITEYLIDSFKLDMYSDLDTYKKYNWVLFPIAKNSKKPIEDEHWRESDYRDKIQWIKWLNNELNIASNNEKSKIIAVDVDTKDIDESSKELKEELCQMLEESKTLTQNTPHGGKHYIFQQDNDIPQKVNIGNLKIDTRTEKGYILLAPSTIDKKSYSWVNLGNDIKVIPEDIKAKLLELMKVDKGRKEEVPQEVIQSKEQSIELTNDNLSGCCNDTFIKLGGVLTKIGITSDKVKSILYYLNRNWLRNPMPTHAVEAMITSLDGYKETEEVTQERAIYDYLKLMMNDVSARDVMDSLRLSRAIVDKYLSKFVKEGKAIRLSRGHYKYREKVEWSDKIILQNKSIKYKVPYFGDIAHFESGDIVLLGARPKEGKTTTSLNIIKQLAEQNIKPYYIYSESGSRFQKTAQTLNLINKDELKFYASYHGNPLSIEIEPNAFTILDWLLISNKENTDSIFKYFTEEMQRKGGILIIMMQLKENYDFYAPNMVNQMPSLAARYILDSEDGQIGHFQIDAIREPKGNYRNYIIPCVFGSDTKILQCKHLI